MNVQSEQRELADGYSRKPLLLSLCAVLLLALLTNWGALASDYLYDDVVIIKDNPLLQGEVDVLNIFVSNYWFQASDKDPLYRPLSILSFAMQPGLAAAHTMAVNMLLNGLAGALLLMLLLQLGFRLRLALIAALLFVTMPLHVEVVANGVGRSELLAACFSLASLVVFFRFARGRSINGAEKTEATRSGIFLCGGLYLAALLSKESAAMVLPLLILLDLGRAWSRDDERPFQEYLLHYVALAIPLGIYLAMRNTIVGFATPAAHELLRSASYPQQLAVAIESILAYFRQTVLPTDFAADYHDYRQPLPSLSDPNATLAVLAFALLVIAAVVAALEGQIVAVLALLWFLITLFPASNLLIPIGVIRADRLAYFPSAGICIFLAWVFSALLRQQRTLGLAALGAFLILQSVSTIKHTKHWHSKEALWSSSLRSNPGSAEAWRSLGDVLMEKEQFQTAQKAFETAKHLRAERGIFDRASTLLLAKLHHRLGNREQAASYHREVLQRNPNYLVSAIALGQIYLETPESYEEALRIFQYVTSKHPDDPHALAHEAEALKRLGRYEEAQDRIREALDRAPDWPYMHLIHAAIIEALGDREGAADARRRAEAISKTGAKSLQ